MKSVFIFIISSFLFHYSTIGQKVDNVPTPPENIQWRGTATDIDGNTYQTLILGTQEWMLENLKTTTFNDGEAITEWEFGDSWYATGITPLYQWAGTSDLNNIYPEPLPHDFYGAMYNEAALASGKLAPTGWRIPSEDDFIELEDFLANDGHFENEATVLKSTFGWTDFSGNGTDLYGFNGLPNGYVAAGGTATGSESIATWATTDINETEQTRTVLNLYQESTMLYSNNSNRLGAGVRCVRAAMTLPIEQMNFRGAIENETIQLIWETIGEKNNKGFKIEKSSNGNDWQSMDFVAGKGDNHHRHHYQLQDAHPFTGLNYYRITSIDFDGRYEANKVISIAYQSEENNISIYPNPSNGIINMNIDKLEGQKMQVKITDNLGRKIWDSTIEKKVLHWQKEMNLKDSGMYFILIQIGNKVYHERLVVTQ